ncbi:MAG: hypothetical protein ACYC3X_26650 [Pirellulaceae bacterium]
MSDPLDPVAQAALGERLLTMWPETFGLDLVALGREPGQWNIPDSVAVAAREVRDKPPKATDVSPAEYERLRGSLEVLSAAFVEYEAAWNAILDKFPDRDWLQLGEPLPE